MWMTPPEYGACCTTRCTDVERSTNSVMKLLVIVFLRSLSLDDEQMAASFQALHATLAPGGKVSEKTEGKLAPSVLKNLQSLLKSTAEGSRI
jgi:hypothetical protein